MLADEARFQATAAISAAVIFALVDRDHDGAITLDECGGWLRAWKVDGAAIDGALLRRLDVGGDGRLTRGPFLGLTREFLDRDDPEAPGNGSMGPFEARARGTSAAIGRVAREVPGRRPIRRPPVESRMVLRTGDSARSPRGRRSAGCMDVSRREVHDARVR